MSFSTILSFTAALLCGGLGLSAVLRRRPSFVHWVFALGMMTLALERGFAGMSSQTTFVPELINWEILRLMSAAFIPSTWLLFSVTFAREDYWAFVKKWKWGISVVTLTPVLLLLVFPTALFIATPGMDEAAGLRVALGWPGYLFYLWFLVSSALILVNLESTLRASSGGKRWRIKFVVFGLGSLFALYIYTSSETLLFRSIDTDLEVLHSLGSIIACLLVIFAFVRAQAFSVEVYLSQTMLYKSITLLVIGIYLVGVGVLAKGASYFFGSKSLTFVTFVVFIAFEVLTILLISVEFRYSIKRYVERHFHRPLHDYRKTWSTFAERTASLVTVKTLCETVAKIVAETIGVATVTIWHVEGDKGRFVIGGSTEFPQPSGDFGLNEANRTRLLDVVISQWSAVDLRVSEDVWVKSLKEAHPKEFDNGKSRYCVPLIFGRRLVGLITVGERLSKEPLTLEDLDLLKMIGDQTAGSLLNIEQSEQLIHAKEMEVFQTVAAFFVHDLKNLASRLSLTMQNLSIRYEDPEFRKDAVRTLAKGVEKLNAMCGGLSPLNKKPDPHLVVTDLNLWVDATLNGFNGTFNVQVVEHLGPVPKVGIDPEEMHKVLLNLLLNAKDAVGNEGVITLKTEQNNGKVVLSVGDNGCGMSKEFVAQSLFRPFKTSKNHGLGIGLFQSKQIVEAHHGEIEVESEIGKGTTFRILLPACSEQEAVGSMQRAVGGSV